MHSRDYWPNIGLEPHMPSSMLPVAHAEHGVAAVDSQSGREMASDGSLDQRFERLLHELRRRLVQLGRDPDVVLRAEPAQLKIRLMLTPPPNDTWQPFRFHPRHLLEGVEPERHAADLLAAWQRASARLDE